MNISIYEAISLPDLTQAKSPYFEISELIQDNPLTVSTIEPDTDAYALATFLYRGVTVTFPVYNDVANWNDKYIILIDLNVVYFCVSDEVIDDLTSGDIQTLIDSIRAAA